MKPVRGYPGYFYTDDGQVYSNRKSKDGSLKPMKIRPDGAAILLQRRSTEADSGQRSKQTPIDRHQEVNSTVRHIKQTNGWLDHIKDLKKTYRGTYWMLRQALKECGEDGKHPDEKIIKEMISDINFAIGWMHTGKRPGSKRGIERRAAYQNEKLLDPKNHAGSPANISDDERFRLDEVMKLLSERERECYELAHGYGFSFQYIGDMLDISKGTVAQYVRRAQVKISDMMRSEKA